MTTTLAMPRRLTVAAGRPTAALPVSQTRIVSARSRSGFGRHEPSRPPVPCSSEPSTTSFRFDRDVVAERPQRDQVHDDVALAVGGARGRTSDRRPRSARTAACATPPRRAAAARRSARTAAPSARPVGARAASRRRRCCRRAVSLEAQRRRSRARRTCRSTHCAARSHSSGGNWRGSATDRMATSSASSVARPRHQLARSRRAGPSAHAVRRRRRSRGRRRTPGILSSSGQ